MMSTRSSAHASASASLFKRNLVAEESQPFNEFFEELHLRLPQNEADAEKLLETQNGAIFKAFWNKESCNWMDAIENVLQKEFAELLCKILPNNRRVELERRHEDKSRSDITITTAPGGEDSGTIKGRPVMFFELKSTRADFSFSRHKDQLNHYVKELLGRHVSIELLPFVLFNGMSYFVGYGKWLGYHKFGICVNHQRFDVLKKYRFLVCID